MSRRRVRVSPIVFETIDELLPPDRGPNGEPAARDFVSRELPVIIEKFAVDFDELPEVDGLSGAHALIAPGVFVRMFVVYGLLLTDGTVELTSISLEPFEPLA